MAITLGGHVSAAGGVLKALERGEELGFQTIQIHPSAPQAWAAPKVTTEEAALFKQQMPEHGIGSVFFHNIYLCNFASEDARIWHGSIGITGKYLALADSMGASGVVTHLGSHKGAGMEAVLDRVIDGLRQALDTAPSARFVIENTAGGGGTIGRSLAEIQMITDQIWKTHPNVGICIDTCHSYAAGIPVHTPEGFDAFMTEFKQRFGLTALACFHLNDSKNDFASGKDRHENIGDGTIGNDGFRHIFHHPDVAHIPFLMEVPGLENKGPDVPNRMRVEALAA